MADPSAAHTTPSDEADRTQLKLARESGDAYQKALDYMLTEVADNGASKPAGDYVVAIAQERAEGMYEPGPDESLVWTEPGDKNCHLEIAVCDLADKRFIPGLEIMATLTPEGGDPIGPVEAPFLWHPGLYHYGATLKVPGDGEYSVRIEIAPPKFMRHDKKNGKRYAKHVTVDFEGFEIKAGQE